MALEPQGAEGVLSHLEGDNRKRAEVRLRDMWLLLNAVRELQRILVNRDKLTVIHTGLNLWY